MDYDKAINNLHNILTHEDKFAEINKSIFDAIDTDNSGTLEREEVESFVKSLLVGIHNDEEEEYDQEPSYGHQLRQIGYLVADVTQSVV